MPTEVSPRRFVLLDRDGTIIQERHYLADPDQVELLPKAAEGLRAMSNLGLGLALVTNQSGLGRGYFGCDQLHNVHARLVELLVAAGVELEGIYYCPHTPADKCACRKPRTGLVDQPVEQLHFDPISCFVVGDKDCDIELGRRIGAISLLVRTGYGRETEKRGETRPDYVADDLVDVAAKVRAIVEAC